MPSLAPLTPASNKPVGTKEVESSSQQQPSADDMNKDDAKKKKKDDEKEIARKKKRALQARERRARKKKEKEEEEARKNTNTNTKINEHDDDDDNCKPPKKKKKKMSNNNNNTTQNTDGHSPKPKKDALDDEKKKVLVEEAVGRGQSIKVRLKLPTSPTQKFGFRLREDMKNYGLPVLTALSPDSPYINSIPSNVINNYWITKLSQSEEGEVNIYSSNMLVEELGKMRSSAATSGNNKNDKSWIDVTFTSRSPLLATVTQKKTVSPKKKETTPVAKLTSASQIKKKKKSVSERIKKATTPVKEKKNSPVIMSATEKQLDQMTNADDKIMAAARFRVAQAELALEFASAQVRSAMNELEDARAELNRTENGSITVTAPQQQWQGKTTN